MKFNLRKKISSMVLVPIILVGLSAIGASTSQVTKLINKEIRNQLNAAAIVGINHYQNSSSADYYIDTKGVLCKGVVVIDNDNSVVNIIKDLSGVDATFFYGDTRVATTIKDNSGNLLLDTKMDQEVYDVVYKEGKTYFTNELEIYGQEYYGYYQPITQPSSGEVVGCFFTGKPSSEVVSQIKSIRRSITFITIIAVLITGVVLAVLINMIIRNLKKSMKQLDAVAEGRLDVEVFNSDIKNRDEIAQIAITTMKLRKSLRNVIGQIVDSIHGLKDASDKLGSMSTTTSNTVDIVERAVSDISKGAMAQAEETTIANDHVMVMGTHIENTVTDISTLNSKAEGMKISGTEALEILEELRATNNQTKEAIEMIKKQTNTTNLSAQKIREATNIITDIAEETNLLSLNASIEAARAGEQGRGFAVVAAQIQKLAEQSDRSAKQIQDIIHNLLVDSSNAVQTMEVVSDIINKQSEKVELSKEKMDSVTDGILKFADGVNEIKDRTIQLDKERAYIVDAVQSLTAIAQQNAASAQETSASTGELSNAMVDVADAVSTLQTIADRLTKEIDLFQM